MSEQLPSEEEALEILRKSGCSLNVIKHCIAVAELAVEIAERCKARNLDVDVQLVKIGALLHDVGRSKTHSINHVIVGAEIAKDLNLPPRIISIIERHVGGGITPEEAKELGWPDKSYMPETLEEKIVSYADKLIEGSRRVPITWTLERFKVKLGADHPAIGRIMDLHEELSQLCKDLRLLRT